LVITVLGVIAIRQGLTSLNISTGSQVQSLLFQTADYGIDQVYLGLDTTDEVKAATTPFGIIGKPLTTGNEVIVCLSAGQSLLDYFAQGKNLAENRIESDQTLTNINSTGYCDVTKSTSFNSARSASLTQVALLVPTDPDAGSAFSTSIDQTDNSILFGTSSGDATQQFGKPVRLRVYSTSIVPALTQSADSATMNACLKLLNDGKRAADAGGQDTVTDCLTRNAVPFSTHTEEYLMKPMSATDKTAYQ
jgi:hypothetical protein